MGVWCVGVFVVCIVDDFVGWIYVCGCCGVVDW